MIDIGALDEFKDAYLALLKNTINGELDGDELYLTEDYSISISIQKSLNNLKLTIDLFLEAKKNNDELAMQAALLRISTFLSGLCGVLDQTREDIDRFTMISHLKELPEDYKIPKHYNYPIK